MEYNYLKKIATGAILWLLASTSFAQSYPSKPVKVVVPYPPGTAVDVVTRMVTQSLAASFGQAFVVENRSGAGSTIGTAAVASAPADGYTVLVQSSALTSTPALMQSLPYDTARDFAGVTTLADLQLVLVVAKSTGIKSVQELIAAARARPGALSFASAGIGTSTHIGTEKFRIAAGFDALHVPFRSTPEAVNETLAGRTDFSVTTIPTALPGVQDGRLVAIAMLSQRSPLLPNVPTIVEAGVPDGDYVSWIGMVAPAKTPREIVNRLHQEIAKAQAAPDVKDRFAKIGMAPIAMTPEQFDALIKRDLTKNAQLIKSLGIKAQ